MRQQVLSILASLFNNVDLMMMSQAEKTDHSYKMRYFKKVMTMFPKFVLFLDVDQGSRLLLYFH